MMPAASLLYILLELTRALHGQTYREMEISQRFVDLVTCAHEYATACQSTLRRESGLTYLVMMSVRWTTRGDLTPSRFARA